MLGIFMVLVCRVPVFLNSFRTVPLKNVGKWLGMFCCLFRDRGSDRGSGFASGDSAGIWEQTVSRRRTTCHLFYEQKCTTQNILSCLIGENMIQWGVAGSSASVLTGRRVCFVQRRRRNTERLKAGFVLLNLFLAVFLLRGMCLNGFSYVSNQLEYWAYGMLMAYILCEDVSGPCLIFDIKRKTENVCDF